MKLTHPLQIVPSSIKRGTVFLLSLGVLTGILDQTGLRGSQETTPQLAGAKAELFKEIGNVRLHIHIFEPDELEPGQKRPAIVFFFGGAWRSGNPSQFQKHCTYLASRGMVAMSAEYRILNRHGTKAFICVKDAKSAIRWIRQNAMRLGVDPDRVAAGGGSAGGHLAAATGTIQEFDEENEDLSVSSVPNAMVLFNPALVLAPVRGTIPFDRERLADMKERMGVEPVTLSPYHHVRKGLPPALIHHGTEDTTVPFVTAQMFSEAMQKAGNRCELAAYEGQGHGFFNWGRNGSKMFLETMRRTDQFLQSLKYVSGSATIDDFVKGEMLADRSVFPTEKTDRLRDDLGFVWTMPVVW